MTYVRYDDKVLEYDYDLLSRKALLRIKLIVEDSQGNITTPITPSYQARFKTDVNERVPARPKQLSPRQLDLCFVKNNKEVHRTVYNPYKPNTFEHKQLIREIINLPRVETVKYKGEVYTSDYEILLND